MTVSELTASEYAHDLLAPDVAVVVREGRRTLNATSVAAARRQLPAQGTVTVGGVGYSVVTLQLRGFGAQLATRLGELAQERPRLRESIARIGHTFASIPAGTLTGVESPTADASRSFRARDRTGPPLSPSGGLTMLDIDDFKSVNDTYGHPQGDLVLRYVARVVRDSSREVDVQARYGREEMALILPHTDLEGAYAIAERVRNAIEALRIPRLDQQGHLRMTARAGVTASADGHTDELIADVDGRSTQPNENGKNRTVRAQPQTTNVFGAE